MQLIKYDAALKALTEARRVDDVKAIRDKAIAVKVYAQQIKNVPMMLEAAQIVFRAQVRAGEILLDMIKSGDRHKGRGDQKTGSQGATPKLSDLKINKSQSSRWQALAKLSAKKQEERQKKFLSLCRSSAEGTGRKTRMDLRKEDEQRIKSLIRVAGKFHTLVVDPPWDYSWLSVAGAAKPGYATMTLEQLAALDIGQWAEDDCHLYLWTTNNFMGEACALMKLWDFQHRTVLTWLKTDSKGKARLGLGTYFRNTTEHVLFGTRGKLRTRSSQTMTHFQAPIGRHSEKPNTFYEIVQRESYLPAGEAFQRQKHKDFVNLFTDREDMPQLTQIEHAEAAE